MNATSKMGVAPKKLYSDKTMVGLGYSVRFELHVGPDALPGRFDVEWSPRMPRGRDGRRVLERYRQARDRFLSDVGKRLDLTAIVAEVS